MTLIGDWGKAPRRPSLADRRALVEHRAATAELYIDRGEAEEDQSVFQPTRSATSASNDAAARERKPVPSARTSNVLTLQRPITFTVNL
jgi:hypothetical protein